MSLKFHFTVLPQEIRVKHTCILNAWNVMRSRTEYEILILIGIRCKAYDSSHLNGSMLWLQTKSLSQTVTRFHINYFTLSAGC